MFVLFIIKCSCKWSDSGQKVCSEATSISHLLFADDDIIFYRSNVEQALHSKHLLVLYKLSSCNLSKTTVSFSTEVTVERRDQIVQELEI